jgi:enoyl-CoA hydratase
MRGESVDSDVLKSSRAGAVLCLTLNRPQARNALDLSLTRALMAALKDFDADEALHVMVITGTDPAFCAGLDLKAFSNPDSPRSEVGLLLNELPRRRKPVIGAVNGAAMTGGLELALGCDFLIASERAKFGDTHTRIGAIAGGGMSSRLPHAIGYRWAKQMSLTCQPIDAATALRIGLVNEVVPHDELMSRALSLAEIMAGFDPALVATVKSVLDRGACTTLAESIFIERETLAGSKIRGNAQWQG